MAKRKSGSSATQLPSGSWRCIAYLGTDKKGKKIQQSVTCSTKTEAEKLAHKLELEAREKNKRISDKDITVGMACDAFIEMKEKEILKNRVSPSTVRSYKSIRKNLISDIEDIKVLKITDKILQNWIDSVDEEHSPKTCKNAYSFVRASLSEVLPKSTVIDWKVLLPYIPSKTVVVPSEHDISELLEHFQANDHDMYLACILSAFGTLRRSELCALTANDVDRVNNTISVNKALIRTDNNDWIVKRPKTVGSERIISMDKDIIDLLPTEGSVIDITPAALSDRFARAVKRLNISDICFHDLRHYSASIMHALGANSKYIMERGGWTVESTLDKHYKGTIDEYKNKYDDLLAQHIRSTFKIVAS